MKELTTQEKAKRFDEALEKARRYYDEYVSRDNILYVEDMEDMFPELKESEGEDESIRKYLYSFVELNSGVNLPPEEAKKILAWLEKQGEHKETLCDKCKKEQPSHSCQDITALGRCAVEHEQKPADKVEPKFKVGNIIKPKDNGHEPWQIMQVDISNKLYRFKDDCAIYFSQEDNYELVEQKPNWNPSDEQIEALIWQVNNTYKGSWQYKATKELLEQLKKIKG